MRTALLKPNPPRARGRDADNLVLTRRVWDHQWGAQTVPHTCIMGTGERQDHVRPENTQVIVCTSSRTVQQKQPSRLDVRHCGDGLQQHLVLCGGGLQLSTHEIFMPQRALQYFDALYLRGELGTSLDSGIGIRCFCYPLHLVTAGRFPP